MPTSGAELFGRESELQLLDEAWENPHINILSFVAWGGVGKTALVNHWLKRRMARDNYRGAERVYAWSFFSQGTTERATSADLFIDQALRWFGDTDPTSGSPWDKGARLARYIRQSRTLLILDGLEPLQHPPGPQEGRLKDAALQVLLVELAAHQPGLCVISTRERVGDLVEFENGSAINHDLDDLSPEAGAQILRSLNVRGDDQEMKDAAAELGGHAFSLTLLGSYLDEVFNRDIGRRKEVENLFNDARFGRAAQGMIAAYEKWLNQGIELAILRLLGLFDRPADLASIQTLCNPPAIVGLTDPLQALKARDWNQAVAKLRRLKLLAEVSPDEPGTLDAHPLVREYFKQQLKQKSPDAWREANQRLYEHLKNAADPFPGTVEAMSPLYAAVAHGCRAGKHYEVFAEVYWRRILRGEKGFSVKQLGAFGADLAALSSFFASPWVEPVKTLGDSTGWVLSQAGFNLRGTGRMREAVQPMQAALQIAVDGKIWNNAAIAALNLNDLYLTIGDLEEALRAAEDSMRFAELARSNNQKIMARAGRANALHQTGRTAEALATFIETEQEAERTDFFYSLQTYWYCDLLLTEGRIEDVKTRASFALQDAESEGDLLSIALGNLWMGRAFLLEVQKNAELSISDANAYLQRAVIGLRQSGMIDELPRGLLTRAEMYRCVFDFEKAERDLTEVRRIASRSGMVLHLADYNLESARLWLSQNDRDTAGKHLATAKKLIDRIGYHRRDQEVQELEAQLGGA